MGMGKYIDLRADSVHVITFRVVAGATRTKLSR